MHPVFCIASLGNKGRPFQTSLQFPWQNKKNFFCEVFVENHKVLRYKRCNSAFLQ